MLLSHGMTVEVVKRVRARVAMQCLSGADAGSRGPC